MKITMETAPAVSGEIAAHAGPCKSNDDNKVHDGFADGHVRDDDGQGLSGGTVSGLTFLSLLCAGLAAWALCRAGDPPAAVVWRLSLLVCGYLAFWIGALSGAGMRVVLFRASYAVLLAFAVGNRLSASAGMVVIFFEAVCVAGFFGYYVAFIRTA